MYVSKSTFVLSLLLIKVYIYSFMIQLLEDVSLVTKINEQAS